VRSRLEAAGAIEGGREEADYVFRQRLGLSPAERFLHARGEVGPHALAAVEDAVALRERGLPLAYALGRAEFAGLTFEVTPDVLIPRPETELLVDRACQFIKQARYQRQTVLDLGCGSGCIGLTLAWRFPELQVVLTDISPKALDVTLENARRLGVTDQVELRLGDWFGALKRRERFDVILCNPPYITRRDDPGLAPDVREFEPGLALFLESDPEEFYYRLGRKAVSHVFTGGLYAVEVGYDTAWPARCALERINAFKRGHEVHDFSGIERVIWATRR
jgi:release factor glutamine methyltransferase